jgi:UBX domain-containing protein 1
MCCQAQRELTQRSWNLQEAIDSYFHPQQDDDDDDLDEDETAQAPASTPAQAAPSSNSQGKAKATGRPKQMTLDDLKKREEDSEEEDDKPQDMFAGGEKSGLAVQNPGQSGGPTDHFKNIMKQAQANRDRPSATSEEADTPSQGSSFFTGRAQTLGGDDVESQVVEDPAAMQRVRQQTLPRVTRTLHLWADGVSIDDGPLFRFDDPANQNIMAEINRGRAPLALLDVQPDQEVDLNLEPHKDENYVQPKKKYKPFGGSGQRLGSPVPSVGTTTTPTAAASSSATAPSSSSNTAQPSVDETAPTISLRIQLGDGTRLTSRFNTTHTIGDVYAFVNAASPASTQRAYALMTTFPSKELEDRSMVLGDMAEFKRGGVVVQKWK